MTVITIFAVYLLIGALMGFKERKMIDEVTDELLEKLPIGINKLYFMRAFALLIMLILPVCRLWVFISGLPQELKWLKTKKKIRKDLKEARQKLARMQAKLDERNKGGH